jgi:hypothetical protein
VLYHLLWLQVLSVELESEPLGPDSVVFAAGAR